jgi:hypothetical protein
VIVGRLSFAARTSRLPNCMRIIETPAHCRFRAV